MNNILEILEDLSDNELVELWNDYCEYNGYEDQLFGMSDFEAIVDTSDFFSTYKKIDHDNFNSCDDYFYFNSCDDYFYFDNCGWICSTSDPSEVIDLDDLACYIEDNIEEYDYLLENV